MKVTIAESKTYITGNSSITMVIPKNVVNILGIIPGDTVEYILSNNEIVIRKRQ